MPQVASLQHDGKGAVQHLTKKGARRAQKNARWNSAGATRPAYLEASGLGFMVAVMLVTLTMDFVWYQVPTTLWVAVLFRDRLARRAGVGVCRRHTRDATVR